MAKYKFGNDILDFDSEDDAIQYAEETGASVFEPIATESPEEMRQRAKSEYAADVMRQRMEYDKENPYLTKIFPGATEAVKSDAPWYIQSAEAAKDLFSGPGRGLMATSDYALDKLWKERPTFEEEQQIRQEHPIAMGIADFGKNIVESPLNIPLIPLGAIGAGTTGLRALGAGLGRVGATAGLVAGDIYSGKAVQGQEMTPGDYGVALASGLLPEAVGGIGKGIRYISNKFNVPGNLEVAKLTRDALTPSKTSDAMIGEWPLKTQNPRLRSGEMFVDKLGNVHGGNYSPPSQGFNQAFINAAKKGEDITEKVAKIVGKLIGAGIGGGGGAVIGGPIGAVIGAPLGTMGERYIAQQVGKVITPGTLEPLARGLTRAVEIVAPHKQSVRSVLSQVPQSARVDTDPSAYNNALVSAMRDNKLSETEYRAYQNPANMARFYDRFPEYR